jgi:DNA-binding CsgD family transcriptional regulator
MARNRTPTDAEADVPQAALAQLRALVHDLGDGFASNSESEQLLIDIELDGQRYLLIRMPACERKNAMLSPRELEIVRLVAEGHPNKVIAGVLEISSWTVCTHMRRVFAKLGVTSRAAMIARLAELGGVLDKVSLPAYLRGQHDEDLPHDITWPSQSRSSPSPRASRPASFTPSSVLNRPIDERRFKRLQAVAVASPR